MVTFSIVCWTFYKETLTSKEYRDHVFQATRMLHAKRLINNTKIAQTM